MNQAAPTVKPGKTQYSEHEAAAELGVTVDQLRVLIRSHIAQSDEDLTHIAVASFHPSDLLVLKLLARAGVTPTPQDSAV
ncbi:MAG TPA: hypothetical protein VNX70_01830 [Bryobacteraceae bacterium]|jgi:hypothetical protein|nr:hypothetical protein [Bryobacteraceae bacterium]